MYALGPAEWQAIDVTFRLCLYTTIILLVLASPLAWWLAKGRSRGRNVVQAIVSLPLVLPPTVLGFYLLVAMGPRVQPLTEAFSNLGRRPVEVASSLGAGALDRFRTVIFPLTRSGFVVAATLTFAHTMGEFGVILMLGGSIPGETKVLSVLIYDHVEAMNYEAAHSLSLLLLIFAFITLFVVYSITRRFQVVRVLS